MKKIITFLTFIVATALVSSSLRAQHYVPTQRVYANTATNSTRQEIPILGTTISEVTFAANAIDNNIQTASSLYTTVGIGGLIQAWQDLKFAAEAPATGTAVTVKLGLGTSVLNLLNGVTVQATMNGTEVGTSHSGSDLLSLLNGTSTSEVTFVPRNSSNVAVAYNGVKVTVSPTLGVGVSAQVYHAYFLKPATAALNCEGPIDMLTGVGSYLLGANLASITGTVDDPINMIDNNASTFAVMHAPVTANAYVQETAIFPGFSVPGDSIRVVVKRPTGLLDLSLLGDLAVQAYNGSTAVGSNLTGSLLYIRLLGGGDSAVISAAVTDTFDRIQVRLGGIVGLLNNINVYSIERVIGTPVLVTPASGNVNVCSGNTTTLTASATSPYTLRWYSVPTGGTATAGNSYLTATITADQTFYVSSTRTGCTDTSVRVPVAVKVVNTPSISAATATTLNAGQTLTLNAASNSSIVSPTYKWYRSTTAIPSVTTGTLTIASVAVTDTGSYSVAVVGTNACEMRSATSIAVNVRDYISWMSAVSSRADGSVRAGDTVTYTIYVRNTGSAALTNVAINDTLPVQLSYMVNTANNGGTFGDGAVSWVIGNLPTNTTTSVSFKARVNMGVPDNTVITNSGKVNGNGLVYTTRAASSGTPGEPGAPGTTGASVTVTPNPLLVTLINFVAQIEKEGVKIEWTTSTEQNNNYFEIQKSTDGKKFSLLATVKGNGTTSQTHQYNTYDGDPADGSNYYRLLQYNYNGQVAYSNTQVANFNSNGELAVASYPNPASDDINIKLRNYKGDHVNVTLTDMFGKTIYQERINTNAGTNVYKLQLSTKPASGQYLLHVSGSNLQADLKVTIL